MDYFKVFIIIDKLAFKKYIDSRFSYDTSFLSDENKDAEIHLVPYTIPYELIKRYADEKLEQEYVTYINSSGQWKELTSIIFDENDIKELIECKSIMDYEKYKQWKEINLFQIKDKQKFLELFTNKLSDIEKIYLYDNSKKVGEQLLYLIEDYDEYYNYKKYKLAKKFEHTQIAHIFPNSIFDEDEIQELERNNLLEKIDCKLHQKYNNISINNSEDYILLSKRRAYGSLIKDKNNRYTVKTSIILENDSDILKSIYATGKTVEEAICKLKEKIKNEVNIVKNIKENTQKNIEESMEDDFSDL